MWKFIRKMCIDIVFVTVLYLVSYSNRDLNAIHQFQHLSQFFLNSKNSTANFSQIVSIGEYWTWLQTSFITNIRVQPWYNGDAVENMTDFINDKSNRIIGWAIMRQLRMRLNASCRIPTIIRPLMESCKGSYSIFSDEQRSYAPGWVLSTNGTYSSSIQNSFIYRTSAELDSYVYLGRHGTYGSGGYVYEFRGDSQTLQDNLTLLRRLSWLDEQSRAVMIQLNLYNPNVKFFTSVTLLIEISNTGQVFPLARIEPMQMYTEFNDFSSIFYLIIASVYIVFIIYFTIVEIYSMWKLKTKYFRQIRSYVEWSIIACSWAGVGVYIWRYHEAHRIGKYFRSTNGFQYINLQFATYVNDLLTFLLGFCCFFGTIRLLRLFNIYPRIYVFSKTLHRAFKDIVAFTFIMRSCSSLLQTSGMLFEMTLLKFDSRDLVNAHPFLGPFAFAVFIYICVFVCFTMFVVIIRGHFRYVRTEMLDKGEKHPAILAFIINDIAKRIGFKRPIIEDSTEQTDVGIHSEHKTPVEQFPTKVDQLLTALEKLYMTYTKSEIMAMSESNAASSTRTFQSQRKRRRRKRVIY